MRKEIQILQKLMKEQQVDFYYVPSEDDHNSEYVAPHFQCRAFLSGFTGSAGTLLVTQKEAFLWTDGRYFLQAQEQLKDSGITLMRMGCKGVPTIEQWLLENGWENMVLGYDGRTMNARREKQLLQQISSRYPVSERIHLDFVGTVWEQEETRPQLDFHPVVEWPLCYAGESGESKCERLRSYLKEKKVTAYVMTELSEIAWLLNLRGTDVECSPVFLSYLLVTPEELRLYASLSAFPEELAENLKNIGVRLYDYHSFYEDLQNYEGRLWADAATVNAWVYHKVVKSGGESVPSPIPLWKAVKNETEIDGERQAHIRDGVAMVNFLYWLKHRETDSSGCLLDEEGKAVTEISAAQHLEEERMRQENYMGPSFAPIVAVGEHGAIVHYSATKESNAELTENTFVLMDTGGQYLEGTTDVTRTVVLGKVTPRMKELYTAVLQGNLELMNALFAKGARGENLDILARTPLWRKGYDYNHGTGHGVGCYLNVHEGPVSIRSHIYDDGRNSAVFAPGMITSDEPGVYVSGEFGIRLENMLVCVEREKTDYQEFLGFEPLTMVPWDRDAILPEQMSEEQKVLLNSYQQLVYNNLVPFLEPSVGDWLFEVTRPIH